MKNLQKISLAIIVFASVVLINSCKKASDDTTTTATVSPPATVCSPDSVHTIAGAGYRLIFKFKFDSTQARLDNVGNIATMPSGHAGQSPKFNFMSQHYIELANTYDSLGRGKVLYVGPSSTAGGATAIDYCSSIVSKENDQFFSIPLSSITAGSYQWLRVSLAYQNYNITYKANVLPGNHLGTGTIASFIGYNTYLTGYKINGRNYSPSSSAGGPGNHLQGYWGFETTVLGANYFVDGQAPAGATTVPNPIFASSPIPAGSCVVTGQFVNNAMANAPLVIPSTPTADIIITISLSTKKSFEWIDSTPDGYYQPEVGEAVVDMGIRGLIPIVN